MRLSYLPVVVTSLTLALASAYAEGIDKSAIDPAVQPGDDFWSYANGNWKKSHPIPDDRSSYGVTAIVTEETNRRTVELIQAAAANAKPGSEARKIGDFYASFMDEAGIEAQGLKPLGPTLARIAAISDRTSLARYLGETLRADVDILNNTDMYTDNVLGLWVSPSLQDPSRYYPFLIQGGLGMPDREYYLSGSEAMQKARTAYVAHVAKVLQLAGIADSATKATRIMALETEIAKNHSSRADSDDLQKGNNLWASSDFAVKAPGLDWGTYFKAAGLDRQKAFVVWQVGAARGIAALAASEPLEDWKNYLTFHAIEHVSTALPRTFADENFAFHGTALQGTPKQRDRWKRAVDATNTAMGEAVGKIYVAKYFPAAAKAKVNEMVRNIIAAYRKRINALTWMAPATKKEALHKLSTLTVGIAYPDKWRDFGPLKIVPGDIVGNMLRAEQFNFEEKRARLGKPIDRHEWVMVPQVVNAVNLPILNALNFPAGILQAPDYDPSSPASVNYGAIGATIGHEISHSFDDTGSQFDAVGRLRNWWTPEDLKQFQAAGEALAQQYDGYKPFPDLGVNGHQTLGENIADLAGLAASYDAWQASLGGKPAPEINGLSGDQQFFLAYAQSWCTYMRDAALRQRLINDGHAPAIYRALTVRNIDAWYKAFPVKEGDKLYLAPDKRVRVW